MCNVCSECNASVCQNLPRESYGTPELLWPIWSTHISPEMPRGVFIIIECNLLSVVNASMEVQIVPLRMEGDILADIGQFGGEMVEFTMESINTTRQKHTLSSITPSVAMEAILCGALKIGTVYLASILKGFFGPGTSTLDLHDTLLSVHEKFPDIIDREKSYVSSIYEFVKTCSPPTLKGPRGPSLCCVFDDKALGVYLHAKTLYIRSLYPIPCTCIGTENIEVS